MHFDQLFMAYQHALQGRPAAERYAHVYWLYVKPAIGDRSVTDIDRLQIVRLSQQAMPPSQRAKAIGLIRQTYRWAGNTVNPETGHLYHDGLNPADRIRLPKGTARERMASVDELRAILKAIQLCNPRHAAFFAVRLTAPSRIKELRQTQPCHWTTLPNGGAFWHKPTTKNGKPQTIYVARQAMAFMHRLDWSRPYFFEGPTGQQWGEDTASAAWMRMMRKLDRVEQKKEREQAAMEGRQPIAIRKFRTLQLLDMRRTLASYLYRLHRRREVDDLTIKALLNHYDGRPVAIYTRLDIDYLANILQGYADWLWGLLAGTAVEPPSVEIPEPDRALIEVPRYSRKADQLVGLSEWPG